MAQEVADNITASLTDMVMDMDQTTSSSIDGSSHSTILHSAHVRFDAHECSVTKNKTKASDRTERKKLAFLKTIKRAKQKKSDSMQTQVASALSRKIKREETAGHEDESSSPLLNPNAVRGQRTLVFEDDALLQENIAFEEAGRTERKSHSFESSKSRLQSSPFQVLSPSFAVHKRQTFRDDTKAVAKNPVSSIHVRRSKPPLPPSSAQI